MHLPPSVVPLRRTSWAVKFIFLLKSLVWRRLRGGGSGLDQAGNIYLSHSAASLGVNVSLSFSLAFSLRRSKRIWSQSWWFSTNKMEIIPMRVRVIVLHLSLFRALHVTLVPTHLVIQFRCLCLFTFGDKKKEWWRYRTRCAGGGIPRPFQSVPPSSSASSCIIKIIAANVDEILFLLVPFCVVSSPLPASVAQFIYSCHSPPSLALLSFAHVLVWSSPSSSCSVSFSQFQNSLCLSLSLSLFAGTVCLKPDGSVCLACVVSFRYYIEFNDNDII